MKCFPIEMRDSFRQSQTLSWKLRAESTKSADRKNSNRGRKQTMKLQKSSSGIRRTSGRSKKTSGSQMTLAKSFYGNAGRVLRGRSLGQGATVMQFAPR